MAHRNDVTLPARVRFGSTSTSRFGVQQVFTASGFRKANQRWASPLRTLQLSYKMSVADIYDILETFHALGGPFDTFLARDWSDWHTGAGNDMRPAGAGGVSAFDAPLMNPNLDPISNQGDGSTTAFHTYKSYLKGATASLNERIRHPVDDASFKVAVGGVEQGGGFSLAEDGGIVTFDAAPSGSPGETLTWGGQFHRAVHFANDDIEQVLNNLEVSSYNPVVLQEARGV